MRRAGTLPASERQFTRTANPPSRREMGDTAPTETLLYDPSLLVGFENEPIMEPDDRRRALSRLARVGPAPVRVAAISQMETMDRARGKQVGPPDPVTDEEYIARLARQVYAAGTEIGRLAIDEAIRLWKSDAARAGASGSAEPAGDALAGLAAESEAGVEMRE